MTPLPHPLLESPRLKSESSYIEACGKYLNLEAFLQRELDKEDKKEQHNELEKHLVYTRILGYLLQFVTTVTGP